VRRDCTMVSVDTLVSDAATSRSWHEAFAAVRYRLVYYIIGDSSSLPTFSFREVDPNTL
jgi:hypothetical protein